MGDPLMNLFFSYLGRSSLIPLPTGGDCIRWSPNLIREHVQFDAPLLQPLRFREAISSLHDIVISDLRFQPRDKSAYEAWKAEERKRLSILRRETRQQARQEIMEQRSIDIPADIEKQYGSCRSRYWKARQEYSNFLRKNDPELWRKLVPCDPVITVAPDALLFECFSADESSYGCLTVNKDAVFGTFTGEKLGTTNVDYSWNLFNQFQGIRTYRNTRFQIDPAGFTTSVQGMPDYREEKIDLPHGWLRGFMQVQAAMGLPMRRISLTREAMHSVLCFLKRHKASKSPRALRFEIVKGQPPVLVLEPWEQRIVLHGKRCNVSIEPIRIWGRQRLLSLSRLLPLAERFDVYLLGTGLPSFWMAVLGDMQLTLGLSGWTTNDWTRGSALDLLMPPARPNQEIIDRISRYLSQTRKATFEEIDRHISGEPAVTAASLNLLAHAGQVIYDLHHAVFRWRQVMPTPLSEKELGSENEELQESRQMLLRKKVIIENQCDGPNSTRILTGKAEHKPVELAMDADGRIKRGKCPCSHHYQNGIRAGPCRHLLALRTLALKEHKIEIDNTLTNWYKDMHTIERSLTD